MEFIKNLDNTFYFPNFFPNSAFVFISFYRSCDRYHLVNNVDYDFACVYVRYAL